MIVRQSPMSEERSPKAGPAALLLLVLALLWVQLFVFPGLKVEAAERRLPPTPASLLSALLEPPRVDLILPLALAGVLFAAVVLLEFRNRGLTWWLNRLIASETGALITTLVVVAFLTRYYLDPGIPGVFDAKSHLMRTAETARILAAGSSPDWTFTFYGGYPLLRIGAPLTYLTAAIPTLLFGSVTAGLKLTLWLVHVGSALAVYSLIRTIGADRRGAMLGAIAVAISFQYTQSVVLAGRMPVAFLYLLYPLLLRDLVRLVREPGIRAVLRVSIWTALLVYAHPGLSPYGVFGGAFLVATLVLGPVDRVRRVGRVLPLILLAGILAAGLVAGFVVPGMVESSALHVSEMYASGSLDANFPPDLAGMGRMFTWSNRFTGRSVGYVGISLFLLFLLGIFRGRENGFLRLGLLLTGGVFAFLVGGGYFSSRSVHFLVVVLAAGAGLGVASFGPRAFPWLLLLVLVDLGPTTIQSPFRPDLDYDVQFMRRAAVKTRGERAIRISLRDGKFRGSEWSTTHDSGQPLIGGPFREGASKGMYNPMLELLDRVGGDLDAGRLSPPTRFGLRMFGCRYLLIEDGLSPVTPEFDDDTLIAVPAIPGLLRVRGVSPAVAVLDPKDFRRISSSPPAGWEAALATAPRDLADPGGSGVSVADFRYAPKEVRFRVETLRDGILLLAFMDYPGLTLDRNGEDVPLLPGPFGMTGVELPAGRHDLSLRFRAPPYLSLCRMISLATVGIIFLAWFMRRRRSQQSAG